MLVTTLTACAATFEKDFKAMPKLYLQECIAINQLLARLCSNDMFRSLLSIATSNPTIQRHLSILLQRICMGYVEVFHTLIGSPSGEKSLTVKEQVDSAIAFAATAAMFDLYPRRKVMNNLYYIIGFVGGQMEKHAKRMARGSGKQACMLHLHKSRYIVQIRDGDSAVSRIISDDSIPTEMVERTERFGGLHYADARCWKFFALLEYLFSKTATVNNFINCAGSVLREISAALATNIQLGQLFAKLCDLNTNAVYYFVDITTCLQSFLLVFGCVRTKDLSLKYNSNLYKGKNEFLYKTMLARQRCQIPSTANSHRFAE